MSKVTIPSSLAIQLDAGREYEYVTKDGIMHILVPYCPSSVVAAGSDKPAKAAPTEEEETPAAPTKGKRGKKPAPAPEPEEEDEDVEEEEAEEDEEEAPAKKSRRGTAPAAGKEKAAATPEKKLTKLFEQCNNGDIQEDEMREQLAEFAEGNKATAKKLTKVADEYMQDADLTVEQVVALAMKALSGEEPPAKAAGGKKKSVSVKDLKKGDHVSIEFEESDDFEAGWYDATVASVGRGGKVTFAFEDGDSLEYDESYMKKIALI